jgi:flagellar biosynthesis protein FlhB
MPESSSQERTEEATPHRRQEARKKGQVVRSADLPPAAGLLAGTVTLRMIGPLIWGNFATLLKQRLTDIVRPDLSARDAMTLIGQTIVTGALAVAPVLLALMVGGIAAGLTQTGFVMSLQSLSPKFDKLNPATGIKRIFSSAVGFELLKMALRLVLFIAIAIAAVQGVIGEIVQIGATGLLAAPGMLGDILFNILLRLAVAGALLAGLDYGLQRWRFNRELRMTKQEVKEEIRQTEGDPQIKARIRRLQRQMARKRMMQDVPKATVVVANPTHFAVALRYVSGQMRAPIVVAMGQDLLAQQIRALAEQHGIPVVENPPLARSLYATAKIGREIPAQMYRAVAEVLAFVYRLRRRW